LVKPKHVEAFIVNPSVNFNILKQFNCALVGQIEDVCSSVLQTQHHYAEIHGNSVFTTITNTIAIIIIIIIIILVTCFCICQT
jgi:hypothetical protein